MAAGPAGVRRPFMPLIFKLRSSNLDPAEWAESIWRSEAVAFVFGFHPYYVSGQEIQRQQRSEERSVHGAATRASKYHDASSMPTERPPERRSTTIRQQASMLTKAP
uniref:Predicted protein n=1 Tax=Physcomitrium patens TaxID=3218 RepID=A9U7P7_PHYPA